jgi:hypothetical protein
MKRTLLLVILVLWGVSAFSQVLNRVSTSVNHKWGIGINAGTSYAVGRTFKTTDQNGYFKEITPDKLRQGVLGPTFSLDLWCENFNEPWFTGWMMSISRSQLKYSATFDRFDTTIVGQDICWNIMGAYYVGYRFSDKLTVSLGAMLELAGDRPTAIFSNRYTLGLMALARYYFSEAFFASARLQGGIPVMRNWIERDGYWAGDGIVALTKKMTTPSLQVGIGLSF